MRSTETPLRTRCIGSRAQSLGEFALTHPGQGSAGAVKPNRASLSQDSYVAPDAAQRLHHSAKAAARFSLKMSRLDRLRPCLKRFQTKVWTRETPKDSARAGTAVLPVFAPSEPQAGTLGPLVRPTSGGLEIGCTDLLQGGAAGTKEIRDDDPGPTVLAHRSSEGMQPSLLFARRRDNALRDLGITSYPVCIAAIVMFSQEPRPRL